ncbi:MAG: tRNA (adenosine(37)-N6)-threonylcarbamoyltransferase complex transferase subunit TsaD [Saprospiraceae bacterium]
MKDIIILGIESSCDDTAVSVIVNGKIKSNLISSQWIHKKYGGVVPEAASRQHVESIVELTETALLEAGILKTHLSAIAVTRGPGLLGSLLVGISFAKALTLSLKIPLIEVNHLYAHLMSLFIDNEPNFPILVLTVSGGHTQLTLMRSFFDLEIIGQSIDDAAGEAFDKTGKLLGLAYPAGPIIDSLSKAGKAIFKFPISNVADFNFSFSGLKTAVLYFLREQLNKDSEFIKKNLSDLCASIQTTICQTLIQKLKLAAVRTQVKAIGIAGGVSANSQLREELTLLCNSNDWKLYTAKLSYCTDNGAMIALAGYYKFLNQEFAEDTFEPLARYPII